MDCIKKRLETLGIKHQGDPTAEEEETLESDQYRPKVPNGNTKPGGDKRKHPPHPHPHPRPHHYAQHRLHRNQRRSYQDIPDTVATDEDPPPYPYPYNCYPRLRRTKNTANDYYHNPYFYRDQRRNHAKRDQPSREFFHARDEKLEDLYDPDFVDLDPGDLNLDPPPVALDPDEPQFEIPRPPMGVRHHQHQHPPHPHPHPRHHHYYHYYEPSIDSEPRGRDRRPRPNTNNPPTAPKPPSDRPPSSTTSSKNHRRHGYYHHHQQYPASYEEDDAHGPPPPPRPRRKRADPTASATSSSAAAAAADGGAKKKRNRNPAASEATDFAYSKGAFVPNDDGVSDVSAPRRARLPLPAPTTTTTTAPSGSTRGGGGGARRSGEPLGSSEEEEFGGDGWVDLEDGYEYGGGAGEDGDWVDEDEEEEEGRPVVSGTELSLRSKDRRRGAADSLMDEEEAVAYGRGGGRGDEVPWSPGWEVSSIRTFSDGEGDVDADGFVNGARGSGRGFFDYARQARARRKGERTETGGGGGGGVDGRAHETRGPGVPRRGFERSRDTPWDASSPYLSPTASTDDWHPGFMAGRSPHPNARYRGRQRHLDSEVDHAATVAAAAAAAQRRKDRKKKEHRSPTPTRPAAPPPPSTSGALSSLRPPRTPSEAARCALGVSAVGLCAAGVKRVVSQAIKWEVEKQVQERLVEEKMERRRRRAKKREEKERKWRERDRLEREAVMAGGRPSLGRRMMSGGKAGIERMRSGGRSARMDSIDQRGDRERLFRGNEVDEDWVDDDDTAEGFPIESEGDFDPGPRRGWRRGWSRSRTPRERGTFYQRPVPRTEPWRRGGGTFESIPLSKYADKGKGVASSGRKGGGPARRLLSDMDTSDIASFITPVGSKPAYAR